ncbi:MAG: trehalase family glycosidase [Ignavibacteriales bacterium]|nr:trehalase family glycosidase [Ignavibacteriales bacterium]
MLKSLAHSLNRPSRSFGLNLGEKTSLRPDWRQTPWFEKFTSTGLGNKKQLDGVTHEGLVYMALHSPISVGPGQSTQVAVGFAASSAAEETLNSLRVALQQPNPIDLSRMNWNDHFSSVPSFECSDRFFNRYYWYRWFGLRLNTQYGSEGNYKRPFVCEGIGYFRAPISYSAPCHMLENRWMHEPDLAQGSLLTFLDNQRDDGGFRGYIDMNYFRQEMFYHADWGNALLQLDLIHPLHSYLEEVYDGLKKYVGYFDRERDEEVSGLYDIDNHYETGQEFMHRYIAVNPKADQDNWGEVFRLKGVDVTVYVYRLKQALCTIAEKLGKNDDADLWKIESQKIKTAVLEKMWDPKEEMFFDVNPASGERTNIKAATCFYPYFTDIVEKSHGRGLKRHLLNKKEFWTPFPIPSSSADDEFFCAEPEWKGKRMNCPWNGRVWPMTNSHIAEALASSAISMKDSALRNKAAVFMTKYVKMMFFDHDSGRPNCFEHYHPFTGTPSVYRGIDDYQHSWVNDLIIKYLCGIRPAEFCVVIDPFPFGVKAVLIDNVLIRGRRLKVKIDNTRFVVWLDGEHHAESVLGKPISIQI